ncbi:MAG: hypothetical protein K2K80_08110 [Clostridia bacterium]|nr:hypothetical protein [Clostridia bacterium]
MHLFKQLVVNNARYAAVDFLAAIYVFSEIAAVVEKALKTACLVPFRARCGFNSALVQIAGYFRISVPSGKHFKHFFDDGRGFLVNNIILLFVYLVAKRDNTAEKLTF